MFKENKQLKKDHGILEDTVGKIIGSLKEDTKHHLHLSSNQGCNYNNDTKTMDESQLNKYIYLL